MKYKKFKNLEDMRNLCRNLLDLEAKEKSAQDSLDMMDHVEDSINLDDDAPEETADVIKNQEYDQVDSVRRSTRERKTPRLFNPGTGPARNWKSDMVVNQALILDSHAETISEDDAEEIFALLSDIDDLHDESHPNAYFLSERFCAYKTTMANDSDSPTY